MNNARPAVLAHFFDLTGIWLLEKAAAAAIAYPALRAGLLL
jgi:hypothetical protein